MNNTNKKTCFIITPIGDTASNIRRKIDGLIDEVLEPVLSKLGYKVVVSHRISDPGSVTNIIIQKIYDSELVIANLTGNNPNVMYEVAIRHACAKPIIHITESIKDLPFDIMDQRTIEYTDDMAGAFKLKEDLNKIVQNINDEDTADNPITKALKQKNIVNIDENKSQNLSEIITLMYDDIKQLKKDALYKNNEHRVTKLKLNRPKDSDIPDLPDFLK